MNKFVKFILILCVSVLLSWLIVGYANALYLHLFDTNFGLFGSETMISFPALVILFTTLIYSFLEKQSLKKHLLYAAGIIAILTVLIWLSNINSPLTFLIVSLPYLIGIIIGRLINRVLNMF